MNILGKIFQVKVSFIGMNKNAVRTYGNPNASFKLIEISVALLTFGVRITVKD
ncbi:hypothetical protein LCGC14_1267280 [marine sediment metagenome]|uniref:Uncharacterized protein n=1 Tax=marine sediment metagenome TaxID=412755 RepID=A0A0F9LJZ6_9ZZZZ